MSFLRGLEEEFVHGDVQVFHEFDASHFISNAKSAISVTVSGISIVVNDLHLLNASTSIFVK